MNISNMDLAQIQANGMTLPGLDPTQLMNLLRHLPNVFTKVRPFDEFNSSLCIGMATWHLRVGPMARPIHRHSPNPDLRAHPCLHVIVQRSSRLARASHDVFL
jgi:hypothetical protein